MLFHDELHGQPVAGRQDDIAEQRGIGSRDVAVDADENPVEEEIGGRGADGCPYQALFFFIVEFIVAEELAVEQEQQADRNRRDDVNRFHIFFTGHDADDFRGKPADAGQQDGHQGGNPQGYTPVFRFRTGADAGVEPGNIRVVDGVQHKDEDGGQAVGNPVDGGLVDTDHMADHDPVALVENHLGQIIDQQRNVEPQRVIPVLPAEKLSAPDQVHEEKDAAADDVDRGHADDAGISFFLAVDDQQVLQHGGEDGHQQGHQHDALVPEFEALFPAPELQGGHEDHFNRHEDHGPGRHLEQLVPQSGKGQVDQQEQPGQDKADSLDGSDVSVPVVLEFQHGIGERAVCQIQRKENLQDRLPGGIDDDLSVLFGGQQPGKQRRRQEKQAALDNGAENVCGRNLHRDGKAAPFFQCFPHKNLRLSIMAGSSPEERFL